MALPEILRSKPTQAKPRHTLYGTMLERPAYTDKPDDITLPEIKPKPSRDGYFKGDPTYDKVRNEFDQQAKVYRKVIDGIQTDEKRPFYFNNDGLTIRPDGASSGDKSSSQPFTGRSEHRDKYVNFQSEASLRAMNRVGLTQAGSFNRDKYRPRVSDKPFSIFGQILVKNNGVVGQGRRVARSVPYSNNMSGHSLVPPITSSTASMCRKIENKPRALPDHQRPISPDDGHVPDYSVPVSLKHKYGTQVVDSLISEADIKNAYYTYQRGKWQQWKRARDRFHPPGDDVDLGDMAQANTTYAALSRHVRSNAFGGPPVELESEAIGNYNQAAITTKPEYDNPEYNSKDPRWKRRKDSMMLWTEHNVINEKMRRTWNDYMKEQSEAQAARHGTGKDD